MCDQIEESMTLFRSSLSRWKNEDETFLSTAKCVVAIIYIQNIVGDLSLFYAYRKSRPIAIEARPRYLLTHNYYIPPSHNNANFTKLKSTQEEILINTKCPLLLPCSETLNKIWTAILFFVVVFWQFQAL